MMKEKENTQHNKKQNEMSMLNMGVSVENTYQLSNMIVWLDVKYNMKGFRLEEIQNSVMISTSYPKETFISDKGNRESESCTVVQCLH